MNSFLLSDDETSVDPNSKPRYGRRSKDPSIWWNPDRAKRHLPEEGEAEKRKRKEAEFQKAFSLPGNSDKGKKNYQLAFDASLCTA